MTEHGDFGKIEEQVVGAYRKRVYAELMEKYKGNQTKVTQALGINRGTVRKRLKAYGLI